MLERDTAIYVSETTSRCCPFKLVENPTVPAPTELCTYGGLSQLLRRQRPLKHFRSQSLNPHRALLLGMYEARGKREGSQPQPQPQPRGPDDLHLYNMLFSDHGLRFDFVDTPWAIQHDGIRRSTVAKFSATQLGKEALGCQDSALSGGKQ